MYCPPSHWGAVEEAPQSSRYQPLYRHHARGDATRREQLGAAQPLAVDRYPSFSSDLHQGYMPRRDLGGGGSEKNSRDPHQAPFRHSTRGETSRREKLRTHLLRVKDKGLSGSTFSRNCCNDTSSEQGFHQSDGSTSLGGVWGGDTQNILKDHRPLYSQFSGVEFSRREQAKTQPSVFSSFPVDRCDNNKSEYQHQIIRAHPNHSFKQNASHLVNPTKWDTQHTYNAQDHDIEDTQSSRLQEDPMILVAPGLSLGLRGSKETLLAIEDDFYSSNTCFSCKVDVFCIQDATYLLCPECKSFSPTIAVDDPAAHGVGLGLTLDDLKQCQKEMARKRSKERHPHLC